jgi:hypothetical protein
MPVSHRYEKIAWIDTVKGSITKGFALNGAESTVVCGGLALNGAEALVCGGI